MMEQKIEKIPFGNARDGREVHLFRIPNNTNDYIELSTQGCLLKGIYLHAPDGTMENVLEKPPAVPESGALLYVEEAGHSVVPPDAVWDVAETGENHVLLTCRARGERGGIVLGGRIMWVNLNRLVLDLFVTPERDTVLNIRSSLSLRSTGGENCTLRTFCPQYRSGGGWQPVTGSPYDELRFQPLTGTAAFAAPEGEAVRPMAEVAGTAEHLSVSIYGNLPVAQFLPSQRSVQVTQALAEPLSLQSGQTCASRVIFGFDRLSPKHEAEDFGWSPLGVFF